MISGVFFPQSTWVYPACLRYISSVLAVVVEVVWQLGVCTCLLYLCTDPGIRNLRCSRREIQTPSHPIPSPATGRLATPAQPSPVYLPTYLPTSHVISAAPPLPRRRTPAHTHEPVNHDIHHPPSQER